MKGFIDNNLCYSALPKSVVDAIDKKYGIKEGKYVKSLLTYIDTVPASRDKFVGIHSVSLKEQINYAKYRSKYKSYIKFLSDNNFISVNHSYLADKINGYPKTYKSNLKDYINDDEWQTFTSKNKKYKNSATDIENQCDIRFKKSFKYSLKHEHKLCFFADKESIIQSIPRPDINRFDYDYHNITNKIVGYRKQHTQSTRFYFNSVMLNNKHKHFLRYQGSSTKELLVNYDFCSFVPTIIKLLAVISSSKQVSSIFSSTLSSNIFNNNTGASLMWTSFSSTLSSTLSSNIFNNNTGASLMWTSFLENIKEDACSLYKNIQDALGLESREDAKKAFSTFRNAEHKKKKHMPLYKALKNMGHADMVEIIENTDWLLYDEIETRLLDDISNIAEEHNLVFIRQHDGWLSTQQDGPKIMEELEKTAITKLFNIKATLLGQ